MKKQEIAEILPWYVNNSLPSEQHEQIEKLIERDDELRQEAELLGKIRQQVKNKTVESPGEWGLQRLKRQIKNETICHQQKRWKIFAIAACLLVIVQSVVIVSSTQQAQDIGYDTLSGSHYTGPVIQIQFKDQATAVQIRDILNSVDASIIEGPSSMGLYRLQLLSNETKIIKQMIAVLSGQNDVIEFMAEE